MEDAATAEISRTQVWQWIRHGALADGKVVSASWVRAIFADELELIRSQVGDERFRGGRFATAARLLESLTTSPDLAEFLTLSAYEHILRTTDDNPKSDNT